MTLRPAKRLALGALGGLAPLAWGRLPGPRLLVLTYHRVLPAGHADLAHEQPGMYVRPETLAMHLGVLRQHFEPVHLDDWLQARAERQPLPRLACAVTFDDGWRDNFEFGYPVLRASGVPATIFLVSALVGGRYSFWPNRLARQLARTDRALRLEDWPDALRPHVAAAAPGPARVEAIDRVIVACKAFSDEQMHALLDALPPLPEDAAAARDLLDEHEIRTMAADGQVRFGSHTRRHTRLRSGLSDAVMHDEIEGSAAEIERITGRRPTLFCYPNGDFTPEAVALVKQHYRGAASTRHGWNGAGLDAFVVHRVGMHEDVSDTPAMFKARVERARG